MKNMKKFSLGWATLMATLMFAGCANVVRVAPHTDLKVIDPVWTTAYITRNHGYLVYDTLFALDENLEPQPQMVGKWSVSDDKKTWSFILRDGLRWHDGNAVTAEDCVASLVRWSKRDGVGQQLFRGMESIKATDAKTFVMQFREPNTVVLDALAKVSANVPFMMPRQLAETDPFKPIDDPTGSGPFKLKRSDWQPGKKVVYVRNKDYAPREEASSLAAGAKLAKADRIEWVSYPSQAAAAEALVAGEVDYVESPSTQMLPLLEGKKNIVVASTDPLGNVAMVRFNTLQPPFDKPAVRKAVLAALNQPDYMKAALGDERFWKVCYSVFPCGTPLSEEVDALKPAGMEAARKALATAGYDGTPVVMLNPVDSPVISALTKVTAGKLADIGMKVEIRDMTWSELTTARDNRGPVNQGGWNIFHTWWLAADVMDPMSIVFSGDRQTGWYGWPDDPALENLRAAFVKAGTQDEKKRTAREVQKRIVETGTVGFLGQFFEPVAYSTRLQGITSPIQFYWGVYIDDKKK